MLVLKIFFNIQVINIFVYNNISVYNMEEFKLNLLNIRIIKQIKLK